MDKGMHFGIIEKEKFNKLKSQESLLEEGSLAWNSKQNAILSSTGQQNRRLLCSFIKNFHSQMIKTWSFTGDFFFFYFCLRMAISFYGICNSHSSESFTFKGSCLPLFLNNEITKTILYLSLLTTNLSNSMLEPTQRMILGIARSQLFFYGYKTLHKALESKNNSLLKMFSLKYQGSITSSWEVSIMKKLCMDFKINIF